MESMPILDILSECRTVMKPRAQMKNIHLHLLENNEPISVYANRGKLKQVLINLLFNAIQYTPTGGKVTIAWEKISPDRVRISITDTGISIPLEKVDQLFQPYNRLELEERLEERMGIGLTVIKKLVEMMGGTIGVTSPENAGSTFWVEMPVAGGDLFKGEEGSHSPA
jgi:signal transduction histidine kinase